MKKVSIALLDLNVLGGIQLMTIDTLRILSKGGYHITLITSRTSPLILNELKKDDTLKNLSIERLPDLKNVTLQMLHDFLSKRKVTINMHGDIQPIMGDIIYFHQFNVDYRIRSPIKERLKILPQYQIRKTFIQRAKKEGSIIAVNSRWTKAEAKYFWDIDATLLHPPVHLKLDGKLKEDFEREKAVITVSRFSRDRGLERVLKVARNLSDVKFILAGHVQDEQYFRELLESKTENVSLYPNVEEEQKTKLLLSSRVYFNPTPYIEGFGVAVVEGMNAGLIPVSRDVGGVVDFVPIKYTYHKDDEIQAKIEEAINEWNFCKAKEMMKKAEDFSIENYERNLLDLVNKVL
ncbi:glycosyltransferase family 4 protein [Sulfuracidifex tepidarius]|uniref:Glycosyl transferase family 1 domain-containing protein n=1 Tax=Sulfuracidifex tepidarius TaxID=1294262 RepID=A0A510DXB8_9CREN|nr:glycosyltransferase family 4 protein [Sulfuracidifex tepidarius]BBG24873.1 hypothetical protein IC006_2207 [Sulfuracidifex tepidarius]BBG27658.1 hypothetical protein IC007_2212 [Sulfuracidifex tepidarius]